MKQNTETSTIEQSQKKQEINPEINPRRAATKFKEASHHVEIMQKRFKVLKVQDHYNRFKTIDHQKRIKKHQNIHIIIQKDKEQLRKSLQSLDDTSELKEKSDQLKKQIKFRLEQAKKHLEESRKQGFEEIKQKFMHNEEKIRENRQRFHVQKRLKKEFILEEERKQRQLMSQHKERKIKDTQLNKSVDSSNLNLKVQKMHNELNNLMRYEQELLQKNSESLQASQIMKCKFSEVYLSQRQSRQELRFLPSIKSRTATVNSKNENISDIMVL